MVGGKYPDRTVDPKDRKRFSVEKRARMLAAAGYQCHYCRKPIKTTQDMHLDHKTPLARGGTDSIENIAVACVRCDFIKGVLNEREFLRSRCGEGRTRPFGAGRGMPKTIGFLRAKMRKMEQDNPASRTLDILRRVLRGERVRVADYPTYINPRHRQDSLYRTIKHYAKSYDFLQFEDGEVWKCK